MNARSAHGDAIKSMRKRDAASLTYLVMRMQKGMKMYLKEVIEELEQHDPDKVVAYGFNKAMSWRGDYSQLAFKRARNVTVREMLKVACDAQGSTFVGYKGGGYTMGEYTDVYLTYYQSDMGDALCRLGLAFMLGDASIAERVYAEDGK